MRKIKFMLLFLALSLMTTNLTVNINMCEFRTEDGIKVEVAFNEVTGEFGYMHNGEWHDITPDKRPHVKHDKTIWQRVYDGHLRIKDRWPELLYA